MTTIEAIWPASERFFAKLQLSHLLVAVLK